MAILIGQDGTGQSGCGPAESARQRLSSALRYLRGLGLRANGDIESAGAYRAVRREASAHRFGRIFLLLGSGFPWRNRIAARLRLFLNVPVDAPVRTGLPL